MSKASPQLRRFVISELPVEPWRNGAGGTRVIASRHDGDALQWRISVADVVDSQMFSSFPELDRTAVLINGAGVDLVEGPMCLRMRAIGDHASFPGEWMPTPELVAGPVQLWNVMTRCGQFNAHVWLSTSGLMPTLNDSILVVLALSGVIMVRLDNDAAAPAAQLQAGEGAMLEASASMTLHPDGNDACALITHILPIHQVSNFHQVPSLG